MVPKVLEPLKFYCIYEFLVVSSAVTVVNLHLLGTLKRSSLQMTMTFSIDDWMDDLRFYVIFNGIIVISGLWADDNERLCAIKSRL